MRVLLHIIIPGIIIPGHSILHYQLAGKAQHSKRFFEHLECEQAPDREGGHLCSR